MNKTGEAKMLNPIQKEVIDMTINPRILIVCSLTAALCVLTVALFADEAESEKGLRVGRIAVCTSVNNREPLDVDTTFSTDVGSLYCFTRIEGITDSSSVTHVWYYGQKKMAEVTLPVASTRWSKRWRTWSNKRIFPHWTGKWTVAILSEDRTPLAQTSFVIASARNDSITKIEESPER
jgi:hypothetical protein